MKDFIIKKYNKNVDLIGVDGMDAETLDRLLHDCDDNGAFVITIHKEDVINKEFMIPRQWLESILELGLKRVEKSRFTLLIDGYNDDPREIFEIPDIVEYIINLFIELPNLYYVIDETCKRWVALCHTCAIAPKDKPGKIGENMNVEIRPKDLINFLVRTYSTMSINHELAKAQFDNTVEMFFGEQ